MEKPIGKINWTMASSTADEGPNYLQQFQQLIKKWDEFKNDPAHYDPTDTLTEMAGILEKVF